MLPILYQSPEFILYAYPLLMGLGWGVAYQVFFSLLKPEYPKVRAQVLFWGIFVCAWLGAKLLFVLTYPEQTKAYFLNEMSFWTGGGFVFYGGFLAALIFIFLFKLTDKKFSIDILWAMLPAIAFGHGIGRIGCYLAGCCFGKPTDSFWGVYMHGHFRHPTQLIEALGLLVLGFYLYYSKKSHKVLLCYYLLFYGILRFVVELLRGDIVRGQWGPFTPSQWISLILIFSGLSLLMRLKYMRKQVL